MSLFQFVIDLLAGLFEKDVVVGGKKTYLFEYDYLIDDKTVVSIKTNGRNSIGFIVPDDFLSEDYECNYRVGSMIPGSSQ